MPFVTSLLLIAICVFFVFLHILAITRKPLKWWLPIWADPTDRILFAASSQIWDITQNRVNVRISAQLFVVRCCSEVTGSGMQIDDTCVRSLHAYPQVQNACSTFTVGLWTAQCNTSGTMQRVHQCRRD